MSSPDRRMQFLLDRANEAEDRADELQREVDLLRSSVKAALNMEPTTASRALMWVGRAERAEELLEELLRYVHQYALGTGDFPPGWLDRAEAQLKATAILKRDLAELAERPEASDYWSTAVGPDGRRFVVRDVMR